MGKHLTLSRGLSGPTYSAWVVKEETHPRQVGPKKRMQALKCEEDRRKHMEGNEDQFPVEVNIHFFVIYFYFEVGI